MYRCNSPKLLPNDSLMELTQCENAKILYLGATPIDGQGIQIISHFKSLQELWLNDSIMENEIHFLGNLKNLKKLIIDNSNKKRDLICFTSIISESFQKLENLEDFELGNCSIEYFPILPKLKNLVIKSSKLSAQFFISIANSKNLETLCISNVFKPSNSFLKSFNYLENCLNLKVLKLIDQQLTNNDFEIFTKIKNLTYLCLTGSIDPEIINLDEAFNKLKEIKNLKYLSIDKGFWDYPEIEDLEKNGTTINDDDNNYGDEDFDYII